jgi:hypothetical protein
LIHDNPISLKRPKKYLEKPIKNPISINFFFSESLEKPDPITLKSLPIPLKTKSNL